MENRKQKFINEAKTHLKRLSEIERTLDGESTKRHIYVYSPPGIGKSHFLTQLLEGKDIPHFKINGAISLASFGIGLAVLRYQNQNKEKILVVVDDCESLFGDNDFANTVKNVLEGKNRSYQYNKIQKGWNKGLTDEQRESIEFHSNPKTGGFEVPTDQFVFIFLSNTKLPTDKDIKAMKSGKPRDLANHRRAIRSRCKTIDLDLNRELLWGWIAYMTETYDIVENRLAGFADSGKIIAEILNWLFSNRNSTIEFSLRTVQKMAESYVINTEHYEASWEQEFLDQKAA